jgi:hypothetical protein
MESSASIMTKKLFLSVDEMAGLNIDGFLRSLFLLVSIGLP